MFHSARLKLTGFYLLIIMLISIIFSMAFHKVATMEIEHGLTRFEHRMRNSPRFREIPPEALHHREELEHAKHVVALRLLYINGVVIALAGGAGWFLAGKTLAPIEKTMEEQKRFISDASHELRTPIAALKTTMEVSIRDKRISTQTRSLFKDLLERINDLNVLTSNLLQLARPLHDSNNHHKHISLHPLLSKTLTTLKPITQEEQITVLKQFSKQKIVVAGNAIALQELFTILLDNAVKYSSANTQIVFSTKQYSKSAVIAVKDNGIGISKKDVPHIFDRFYRVDNARTKTDFQGHGLGLSVAKRIVANHKGTIHVDSKKGSGTEVVVKLPLA